MKAQDLKNSILQLAIQGKLVPQDPNDEPAEVLYAKIQAEKQKLIKEGKIKKDKPLPSITDDEIPFPIPSTWKWVRLGDIAVVNGGFAFKSTQYKDQGIRVVRISDFDENGFKNNKIVRYDYSDDLEQYLIDQHNIIMAMTGGTVGKSFFVATLPEKLVSNQRVATIKVLANAYAGYVNIAILAPVIQKLIQVSKNSTNDNISMDLINNFPIPLPPLAEQKRIVAKIEELEPLIKQYEQAETELSTLNDTFPEQLKKSILQYAIQGKLVSQDPNDEPAEVLYTKIQAEKQKLIKEGKIKKDKPLPLITDDEIPFPIPSTWKWVRLGDIINLISGRDLLPNEYFENYNKGSIPYITGASNFQNENILINRYTSNPTVISQKDDLLMTCKGTIGTIAFLSCEKAHIARQVMAMRVYNWFDINYLKYFLIYCVGNFQSKAKSIIPGISRNDVLEFNFPLPPLVEQHRIVTKINALMQYCEKLK